jgi:hypothetical protein
LLTEEAVEARKIQKIGDQWSAKIYPQFPSVTSLAAPQTW